MVLVRNTNTLLLRSTVCSYNMADDALVTVSNLSKSYGDVEVLDDVEFSIPSGEVFGILGPNGVGKTTLIKLLTGQLSPDSGEVSVFGFTPWDDEIAVREKVGILPEKQSPPSYLTPREFFQYVGLARGLTESEVSEEVEYWAEYLGYTTKLDTLSANLSRGQQQKVMLTQALLHNPQLVFIDEPVANLDPLMQEKVKDFIGEYVTDENTVVLSTHHIEFAADLCTGILSVTEDSTEKLDEQYTADALLDYFEQTW